MSREFRKLAEEYAGRVYTYALYSLRRREDAEDVTQEVLVRLWRHQDSIAAERTGAWVMRVARNLVIDAARRRRSHAAVFAEGPAAETSAGRVASPERSDREYERHELQEALEDAIAALDEPYRSIVIMREIQGLAYEEIARGLDMPLGTIKVYLHRARKRLRTRVQRERGHHAG
jgi:RNA polymerase sigma-70 factor (ECF subfamily)